QTMELYKEFAEEMRNHSAMSERETLALLKKAESFSLSGEAAKRASHDAVALAAVNGGAAESMIRITAAVEQGNIKLAMHMSRLVPQLRGIHSEAEFVDKYNKLIAVGFETSGR